MVFLMMAVRIEGVYLKTVSYGVLNVVVPNDMNDDINDGDINDIIDGDDDSDDSDDC